VYLIALMELNDITYLIRKSIYEVHKNLGPGLLESVYEKALIFELINNGLTVANQLSLPVVYKGNDLQTVFRIDILVNNEVLIEIKSIDVLLDVHKKQVLTYLRLAGLKIGILVNFNASHLKDKESLIRIIN
jgi:GxxExxY protein